MKSNYIFVYGTLKKNYSNHSQIKSCEFISNGLSVDSFSLYSNKSKTFPYLLISKSNNRIKGEVYLVKENYIFRKLDIFEGFPNLYLKKFIKVQLDNKEIIDALCYYKNEINYTNDIDLNNLIKEWIE